MATFCRIYDLDSHQLTVANGHATETFVLNDTCDVWLESYKLVDRDGGRFGRQELFDGEHALLGPGTYTLTVDVPACGHQVDFALGTNRRIIDTSRRLDLPVCEEVTPTTLPQATPTTTTTTSTTTPLPPNSPTTAPISVLGSVVLPAVPGIVTAVGAAERTPQGQLPITGAMIDVFSVVGVLSIVFGSRLRRHAITRRGGS